MSEQFLEKFIHQLFDQYLTICQQIQPLNYYTEVLVNVCKKIQQVCNNSRIAISAFCNYIGNNLLSVELDLPSNPHHHFLQSLKTEENYVKYFIQISIRFIFLSYICKLGLENSRKQWKVQLKELILQARIQFMFNCQESLADCFVTFINRTQAICNQLPFYQTLNRLFLREDLEYAARQVQQKISHKKQKWKLQYQNKKQLTPKIQKIEVESKTSEKVNRRKSVTIIKQQQKQKHDQKLKKRISEYRKSQKIRFSEHIESSKRRTIFQQRKYLIKMNIGHQDVSFQYQQLVFQEQNNNASNKAQKKIKKDLEQKKKRDGRKQKENMETDEQIDYFVNGTPPKSRVDKKEPLN